MSYWSDLADRAVAIGGEVVPTPIIWPPRVHEFSIGQLREVKRITLYIAQLGKCFWCRDDMSLDRWRPAAAGDAMKHNDRFATFEHLKRRRDGGTLTPDNARLSHAGCNRKRDAKNHLDRYAHDPYPVGPHVSNIPADDQANPQSARARRRATAQARAIANPAAAPRLSARPMAPLVQGKSALAAAIERAQAARRADPPK